MAGLLESPNCGQDLDHLISDGLECLNRHQLNDAEEHFEKILSARGARGDEDQGKVFAQALSGLGEIHFKRARSCRSDDLEWHHQMLQASVLEREILELCQDLESKSKGLDEREKRRWYWTEDFKKQASQQLIVINKLLAETFQQRMTTTNSNGKKVSSVCTKGTHVESPPMSGSPGGTGWLDKLDTYISQQDIIAQKQNLLLNNNIESSSEDLSLPSDDSSTQSDTASKSTPVKVDCGRVQNAIMKLVRQISSDMRQRYVRKKLPEEMFRTSVSSEMIAQFAPMPESRDVLSMFENAIIQYKYGMTSEEFQAFYADTHDTQQGVTEDEVVSDSQSEEEEQDPGASACIEEPEVNKDDQKIFLPMEDKAFRLSGVITIWKAYNKLDGSPRSTCPQHLKPYLLQGFEEMSPLTETALLSADFYNPQETLACSREELSSENSSLSAVHTSPKLYITEHKLKHALALTSIMCADNFQGDEAMLSQASELYIFALGILQSHQTNKDAQRNQVAHVLKNMGLIRCSQGNMCIGSQLLHESIELYSTNDNMDNINVAEVLFALGDAYMNGHWKTDCISEHVMKLVKSRLDQQASTSNDDECCPDDASIDSDSSDEEGESYNVCAYEAIGCYESALAILGKLRKRKEVHTSLYVDVLTKLGDCSIVVSEFERAVLCYEEALYLCQDTLGSVSLTNSAHILSMLGTTNLLLGTHSKAATMYQTAQILQQHLYGLLDNFEMAITLTMQGITYFEMKLYHKCIAMSIKAFDLYKNIYQDNMMSVKPLHRWFIVQTLYYAGYSYSTVGLSEKALNYLDLAQSMVKHANEEDLDIHQQVKILKCTADIYESIEMNATALEYYQQALDQSLKLGDEQSATTLHNQLLNRMAGVLVCTKEYGAAADFLEQALDCQRNVETSIKGDLIGTLQQLGRTYTLSGDIHRAIECYDECHEAYQEAEVTTGSEIAKILCYLGTLYHVKGCMQDDNDDMLEYLDSSDQYYRDAITMDPKSAICVYYANFLHQQGQYAEALLEMLSFSFTRKSLEAEIQYNGPEQAVLPEHLLYDLDHIDEVTLDAQVFARFLGVVCLKQIGLMKDAEDCLVGMVHIVHQSPVGINHSMLGYALLEMGLYLEAAESFSFAVGLQHDNSNAFINQWLSVCLWSFTILSNVSLDIWVLKVGPYINSSCTPLTPSTIHNSTVGPSYPLSYEYSPSSTEHIISPHREHFECQSGGDLYGNGNVEDADYHRVPSEAGDDDEWIIEEEVTVETPSEVLEALGHRDTLGHRQYSTSAEQEMREVETKTWNIYDYGVQHSEGKPDLYGEVDSISGDKDEVWVTEEETVETPDALLLSLQNNNFRDESVGTNPPNVPWRAREDANGNGSVHREHRFSESSTRHPYPKHTEIQSWCRDYDSLNRNSSSAFTENANIITDTKEEVDEGDQWNTWVTTEEVIETPAELLEVILANKRV